MLLSIKVFKIITFIQNIVKGGRPPRLPNITIEYQNLFPVLSDFLVSQFIVFRSIISVEEYKAKNAVNDFVDKEIAITSHALLFNEDKAIILFVVKFDFNMVRGVTRDTKATIIKGVSLSIFFLILIARKAGRIFCHVIKISKEFCFI